MNKVVWMGVAIVICAGLSVAYLRTSPGAPGHVTTASSISAQDFPLSPKTFVLASPAFAYGEVIPREYTCDGAGTPPLLTVAGVPAGTRSLVLIMQDPDVSKQLRPDGLFVHWVMFNIPMISTTVTPTTGVTAKNTKGDNAYMGPCPPPEYEPKEHRYFFTLFALDAELPLDGSAYKRDVIDAMRGHVIGKTQLMGRYTR
jgi:Raf kinase inhibitor-like YbhB/YbcL family protein